MTCVLIRLSRRRLALAVELSGFDASGIKSIGGQGGCHAVGVAPRGTPVPGGRWARPVFWMGAAGELWLCPQWFAAPSDPPTDETHRAVRAGSGPSGRRRACGCHRPQAGADFVNYRLAV